jgi:hypothetical protein
VRLPPAPAPRSLYMLTSLAVSSRQLFCSRSLLSQLTHSIERGRRPRNILSRVRRRSAVALAELFECIRLLVRELVCENIYASIGPTACNPSHTLAFWWPGPASEAAYFYNGYTLDKLSLANHAPM